MAQQWVSHIMKEWHISAMTPYCVDGGAPCTNTDQSQNWMKRYSAGCGCHCHMGSPRGKVLMFVIIVVVSIIIITVITVCLKYKLRWLVAVDMMWNVCRMRISFFFL